MTNDVKRYNLKTCPACKGTGKATIFKEYTWEPIVCLMCLGEGYLPAPEPEEKPASGLLYAALTELERTKTDLASAQAEIARLREGLQDILEYAQTSRGVSNGAFKTLADKIARLNESEDHHGK